MALPRPRASLCARRAAVTRLRLEMLCAPASLPLRMKFVLASLSLLALASAHGLAASAFTALQLLPPEQARNVAMIAGRDGTPEPDRWHFLVHDPKSESGLREVVVSGGRKTADRTISQFAESLSESDVIGPDALQVDSVQVAQLARDFGFANKAPVSAMHFELRKSGPQAVPLWTVTCLDASGTELGKVIVSAARGTVILHPGFAQAPPSNAIQIAARGTPAPVADDGFDSEPKNRIVRKSAPKKRATPKPATPRPGFLQRVFGGQNR